MQVIANTNGILGVGGTPHEVLPRPGRAIVDVDQLPFKGPKTPEAKWHKVCEAAASLSSGLHLHIPLGGAAGTDLCGFSC